MGSIVQGVAKSQIQLSNFHSVTLASQVTLVVKKLPLQ